MRRGLSRSLLPLALLVVLAVWQFNRLHGILELPNLDTSPAVHPVEAAITAAEQHYVKLMTRQTRTVEAATADYKRRYGIDPPPHFDRWFALAQQNEFVLIDEFDTIMASIAPFRAIPPGELRKVTELALKERPDQLLRYEILRGKFLAELGSGHSWFADNMRSFMPMEWLSLLPDMTLAINVLDEPQVVLQRRMLDQLMNLGPGSSGDVIVSDKPFQDLGRSDPWSQFLEQGCQYSMHETPPDCAPSQTQAIEVVANMTASQDVCAQCGIRGQEGLLMSPDRLSLTNLPIPILSQAKPSLFNDILFPSPHYFGISSHEHPDPIAWEDKQSRLYWTGSATGGFVTEDNWRNMQRQKLALKLQKGSSEPIRLLTQDPTGRWLPHNATVADIEDIVDVRITGIPEQCEPAVCEKQKEAFGLDSNPLKDPEDLVQSYKFLLDIDGNSFSGRFHRLLRTNAVVFQKSIFQEWHQDRLIPWVHYIPISSDGDELPEIVRFLATTDTGDRLARKIALNSRDWAERSLRHVDLQLVLLRILLELGRIMNE